MLRKNQVDQRTVITPQITRMPSRGNKTSGMRIHCLGKKGSETTLIATAKRHTAYNRVTLCHKTYTLCHKSEHTFCLLLVGREMPNPALTTPQPNCACRRGIDCASCKRAVNTTAGETNHSTRYLPRNVPILSMDSTSMSTSRWRHKLRVTANASLPNGSSSAPVSRRAHFGHLTPAQAKLMMQFSFGTVSLNRAPLATNCRNEDRTLEQMLPKRNYNADIQHKHSLLLAVAPARRHGDKRNG